MPWSSSSVLPRASSSPPRNAPVELLLRVQMDWSALPTKTTLLAEVMKSREGWHLFLYPFAGRHVHLGLASLLARRMGQRQPLTFSIAVNDYGLELLSATEVDWLHWLTPELFSENDLLHDVLASLNASELARRRFREIARIAGLVFSGYPVRRRARVSCRLPVACSSMCSASTIQAICC